MKNFKLLGALAIALLLTIMPVPWVHGMKPAFILLFILYLQFFLPQYFNVITVFLLGIFLDILLATVLGEHGCALLLASFVAKSKARRFTFFHHGQQMILVFIFTLIYQVNIYFIEAFLGNNYAINLVFINAILSMLIWPGLKTLLNIFFAKYSFVTK